MMFQRTLANSITAVGVGLHTGRKIRMTLRPAPENTGILFSRTDVQPILTIQACEAAVTDTCLSTTIGAGGITISTIEHLMAAFAGMGIDNACVDIDGPEIPIMDGSAAPFLFLIRSAGIVEQSAQKRFIRIKKKVKIEMGKSWAKFRPYPGSRIDCRIDFEHPLIAENDSQFVFELSSASMSVQISRARTFGFLDNFESLREAGLARGGSLSNAVIFSSDGVVNEDGLRYADECVRHKTLDALGDIYLAGAAIIGEYRAYRSGHAINVACVQKLMQKRDAWEWVEARDLQDQDAQVRFEAPVGMRGVSHA